MQPRISVVTVNYNNKKGLLDTIRSVKNQSYLNIEFIIIDGGSTDGSREVIQTHADKITYWRSEPDSGIYNAMNKGIQAATGDYILFLNSGDHFFDDTALERLTKGNPIEEIIYGDLMLVGANNQCVKKYLDKLTFYELCAQSLPHPATLIRKDIFDVVGLYDEANKIVSDWAFFMLAIFRHNVSYKHIDEVISTFYLDGISHDVKNNEITNIEREQFLQINFKNLINDYLALKEYEEMKSNLAISRTMRLLKKLGFFSYLN